MINIILEQDGILFFPQQIKKEGENTQWSPKPFPQFWDEPQAWVKFWNIHIFSCLYLTFTVEHVLQYYGEIHCSQPSKQYILCALSFFFTDVPPAEIVLEFIPSEDYNVIWGSAIFLLNILPLTIYAESCSLSPNMLHSLQLGWRIYLQLNSMI